MQAVTQDKYKSLRWWLALSPKVLGQQYIQAKFNQLNQEHYPKVLKYPIRIFNISLEVWITSKTAISQVKPIKRTKLWWIDGKTTNLMALWTSQEVARVILILIATVRARVQRLQAKIWRLVKNTNNRWANLWVAYNTISNQHISHKEIWAGLAPKCRIRKSWSQLKVVHLMKFWVLISINSVHLIATHKWIIHSKAVQSEHLNLQFIMEDEVPTLIINLHLVTPKEKLQACKYIYLFKSIVVDQTKQRGSRVFSQLEHNPHGLVQRLSGHTVLALRQIPMVASLVAWSKTWTLHTPLAPQTRAISSQSPLATSCKASAAINYSLRAGSLVRLIRTN